MPFAEANGRRSTMKLMKLTLARSMPAARTRLELCTNAASASSGDWAAIWAKISNGKVCFCVQLPTVRRSFKIDADSAYYSSRIPCVYPVDRGKF